MTKDDEKAVNAVSNLINGNLEEARKQSKSLKYLQLRSAALNHCGQPKKKAAAIALYLKGQIDWDEHCKFMQDDS